MAPRSTSWHTKRGSPSRVAEPITKTKVYIKNSKNAKN
jgi:hypothetical protein